VVVQKPSQVETDHFVSLELAGSNSEKNLWPQPFSGPWNAHQKDAVENYLHRQVCLGKMTLEEAQRQIRTDWRKVYQEKIKKR
jgi:hypothetical protein